MAKKKTRTTNDDGNKPAPRRQRPFPASTFEDALVIAQAIQQLTPEGRVRRLTLFEHLNKSPDSGLSRQLVTNSGQYSITKGSYKAEHLELTTEGTVAVSSEAAAKDRLRARFKLAIESIDLFRQLNEKYAGSKLPTEAVMRDFLIEKEVPQEFIQECIETFIANIKYLGLLKTIGGAERLITMDHALDELPKDHETGTASIITKIAHENASAGIQSFTAATQQTTIEWEKTCFYVTPIGDEGSPEREHADLMTGSFVEPAMEPLGLTVKRSDRLGHPGMIASQIMEHIKLSRLVVADMSLLNPSVFYEMALRHCLRKPLVQIIRRSDKIPFDVNQVRTVVLDFTDIFTLVPKLVTYRSEITSQARRALEDPDSIGNPISVFYPRFWD